ncbi:MAG: hypothetical protein AAFO79_12730, partial [Pseudomonadota bacterium]
MSVSKPMAMSCGVDCCNHGFSLNEYCQCVRDGSSRDPRCEECLAGGQMAYKDCPCPLEYTCQVQKCKDNYFFDKYNCECECQKQHCYKNFVFDESCCECKCDIRSCPKGFELNPHKCQCECNLVAPEGFMVDPKTCSLVCVRQCPANF